MILKKSSGRVGDTFLKKTVQRQSVKQVVQHSRVVDTSVKTVQRQSVSQLSATSLNSVNGGKT